MPGPPHPTLSMGASPAGAGEGPDLRELQLRLRAGERLEVRPPRPRAPPARARGHPSRGRKMSSRWEGGGGLGVGAGEGRP